MAKQLFDTVDFSFNRSDNQLNRDGNVPVGLLTGTSIAPRPTGHLADMSSKYDSGYTEDLLQKDPLYVERNRAAAQSGWSELSNALYQGVVGEVIGGTIEGIGYLTSLDTYGNAANDLTFSTGNAIAQLGRAIREGAREDAPIHVDPSIRAFDPFKREWWMSNAPTILSSLSMMIPSGLAVKGMSVAAKAAMGTNHAAKLMKTLGTMAGASDDIAKAMGSVAARGITQAVISRHMESMMESSQIYIDEYNKYYKEKGLSHIEASQLAAEAATHSYRLNWAMLLLDVPQYMLLNKAFATKAVRESYRVRREMGEKAFPIVLDKGKALGLDMLGEGAEEAYQYISGEEGRYLAEKSFDPELESRFGDRLGKYLADGHLWTGFVFGALGAGVMQTAGKAINTAIMKAKGITDPKDAAALDIKSWSSQIRHAQEEYLAAEAMGDENRADFAKSRLISLMVTKSKLTGNDHNLVEFLEKMKDPSPEDMKNFAIEEDQVEFLKSIPNFSDTESTKATIKRVSDIYDNNYKKLQAGTLKDLTTVVNITREEHLSEVLNDKLTEAKNERAEAFQRIPKINDISPLGLSELQTDREIAALTPLITYFKKQLSQAKGQIEREVLEKTLTDLSNRLLENKNLLQKIKKDPEYKNDTKADKKNNIDIKSKAVTDLYKLDVKLNFIEESLKTSQDRIDRYSKLGTVPTTTEPTIDPTEDIEDKYEFKEGDITENTNPETGEISSVKIVGRDPSDPRIFLVQTVDEKGVPQGDPFQTIEGNMKFPEKETDEEDINQEAVDDKDADADIGEPTYTKKNRPKDKVIAVYSSGDPRLKREDFKLYDEVFAKFISTVTTDVSKINSSFEIDFSYAIKENLFGSDIKKANDLIKRIKNGELSQSEIDKLLEVEKGKVGLADSLPIKVNMIYNNKVVSSNIFLYKSNTKEESEFRRRIVSALLANKEVSIDTITLFNSGVFNNVDTKENISKAWGIKSSDVVLAIGKDDNNLYKGVKQIGVGTGNPGTIVAYTNKTPGKKNVPVKVNASKLSEEHAEILWDALRLWYSKKEKDKPSGRNAVFEDGRVEGLTVSQVISILTNFGEKSTSIVKEDGTTRPDYLKDKQLFVSKDVNRNNQLTFGINTAPMSMLLNNDPELKADFIKWAVENKNYAVMLAHKDLNLTLNGALVREFKIGKTKYNGQGTYASFLIDNNFITTDVAVDKDTGSVMKNPIVQISTLPQHMQVSDKVKPKTKSKPKVVEDIAPVETETKTEEPTTPSVEEGNNDTVVPSRPTKGKGPSRRVPLPGENKPLRVFKRADKIKQQNVQKELGWVRSKLGKRVKNKVNLVDKLIKVGSNGVLAYGQYSHDAITLFRFAEEGTLYHEAFHRVSLGYLSPEERKAIYAQARKDYKLDSKMSDRQVEEVLAEKFRDYILEVEGSEELMDLVDKFGGIDNAAKFIYETEGGLESISEIKQRLEKAVEHTARDQRGVLGFFRDLLDFITTFFTGKYRLRTYEVDSLFKSIQKGKFKHARVRPENINNLDNILVNRMKFKGGVFESTDTPRQVRNIVKGLTQVLLDSNNVFGIDDVNQIQFSKLIDSINKKIEGFYYEAIVDGKTVTLYQPGLKELIVEIEGELKEELSIEIRKKTEEELNWQKDYLRLYTEILEDLLKPDSAFKQLIDENLRYLGVVTKRDDAEDHDDETVSYDTMIEKYNKTSYQVDPKASVSPRIKFLVATLHASNEVDVDSDQYLFTDFSKTWSSLLYHLHDANSIEEMISILEAKSNKYEFAQLAGKLKEGNSILRNQFWTSIKMHKHAFVSMIHTTLGASNNKTQKYLFSNADVQSAEKAQINMWNQSIFRSKFVKRDADNKSSLDKDMLSDIQTRYTKIAAAANTEYGSNGDTFVNKQMHRNAILSLLNEIMIGIDDIALEEYLSSKVNEKTSYHEALFDFIKREANIIFNTRLNKVLANPTLVTDAFKDESIVTNLARAYVSVNPELINDSVLGPDNNIYYTYALNSFTSDIINLFKRDAKYATDLSQMTYHKRSVFLEALKNDPAVRDKIQLFTYSAIVSNSDTGRKFLDISPTEDMLLKLHAIAMGYLPFPTLADRQTYYLLKGMPIIDFQYVELGDKVSIPESVVDTFYNYLLDEKEVVDTSTALKEEYIKLKELYYSKEATGKEKEILKNTILDFQKQFVEHFHFKKLKNSSNKNIYIDKDGFVTNEALNEGGAYRYHHFVGFNKEYLDKIANFNFDLDAKTAVRSILEKRIKEQLDLLIDKDIVKTTKDGVLYNRFIDTQLVENGKKETGSYALALNNIIAKYVVNTIAMSIETEKMFSGHPGFYKSDKKTKETTEARQKRLSILTSTGNNLPAMIDGTDFRLLTSSTYRSATFDTEILRSTYYEHIKARHEDIIYKKLIVKGYEEDAAAEIADKMAKDNTKAYLEVDPTDAQVYITPEMFMAISYRLGQWDDGIPAAYELLNSDKELSLEEEQQALRMIAPPLKLVHFSLNNRGNIAVPIFDKMSIFTLFPRYVKGTELENVLNRMISEKIDMMKFDTAVKVGGTIGANPNTMDGMIPVDQEFKFLRRQLVTDPHDVDSTKVGTQFIKIAIGNIEVDAIYTVDGNKIKGSELISTVHSLLGTLSKIGKKELSKKIYYKNGQFDKNGFYKLLAEEATKAGMPDSLIEALTIDENGEYYLNIDSFPDRKWVQSRIISLVNKHIIDRTLPGNQLIQLSNYGIKSLAEDDTLKFITMDVGGNKVIAMEAKISIRVFKNMIDDYDNKTFAEKVQYIKDNKLDELIAYRIPTQGLSSIVAFKAVAFYEEGSGDVISLPAEFTALTGSDFDIDKLFIVRHHYRVNAMGRANKVKFLNGTTERDYMERYSNKIWDEFYDNKRLFTKDLRDRLVDYNAILRNPDESPYVKTEIAKLKKEALDNEIMPILLENKLVPESISEFKELPIEEQNGRKAIENRLVSSYLSVLLNPVHFLEATMPLGALKGKLKTKAAKVNDARGIGLTSASLFTLTPSYQTYVKFKNTTAKDGIGAYSLNKAHHVLAQHFGLSSRIDVGFVEEGLQNVKDGNVLLGEIEGVDGINISEWLSVLIDAHVDAANDSYIIDLNINPTTYDVSDYLLRSGAGEFSFDFIAQAILFDLSDAELESGNKIKNDSSNALTTIKNKYLSLAFPGRSLTDIQKSLKKGEIEIPRPTKSSIKKDLYNYENRDSDFYLRQLGVLEEFSRLKDLGKSLFNLVQISQIDTKKYGKNISELKIFLNSIESFDYGAYNNADKFLSDDSFLGAYLENGLMFANEMLSDLSIYGTTSFSDVTDLLLALTNKLGMRDTRFVNAISDELFTAIVSDFFKEELKYTSASIKRLFMGDDSIVIKISDILSDKYREEKQYPELSNNILINHLVPVFQDSDIPMYFRISSSKISDKWEKDDIIRDWEALLGHKDPTIQALGKKLFVYAFYSSGFRNRIYSFNSFIPSEIIKALDIKEGATGQTKSLDKFIKDKLIEYKEGNVSQEKIRYLIREIFINNWHDKSIVPEIAHTTSHEVALKNKDGEARLVRITDVGKGKNSIYISNINGLSYRPFVTINSDLYEYIGTTESVQVTQDGEISKIVPLYLKVQKRGYKKSGVVVVEYGLDKSIIDSQSADGVITRQQVENHLDPNTYKPFNILTSPIELSTKIDPLEITDTDEVNENNPVSTKVEDLESKSAHEYNSLSTPEKPLIIYVDGSDMNKQDKTSNVLGYGAWMTYNGEEYIISGSTENMAEFKEKFPTFSNNAMELMGFVETLRQFKDTKEHLLIRQDGKGVINYGGLWNRSTTSLYQRDSKPWNAKEEYIKYLVEEAVSMIEQIEKNGGSVKIQWVPGHTDASKQAKYPNIYTKYGVDEIKRGNDMADIQAKSTESKNTIKGLLEINKYDEKTREATPTTSTEIKSVANIPQNLVSGIESFGTIQESTTEVKNILGDSPHSIDMIEAGLRTRTTRSVGEMEKYNIKVGDVVTQFGKSANGATKQILTRITAIHPKGTPGFLGTWNKEGWTQDGISAIERFKDGAAAIEFEIFKPSTQITQEVVDKINAKHKSSHTIESLQSMNQKELDNLLNCL